MLLGSCSSSAASVPVTCGVSVLVAAALWAVACDETVPNGAPEAVGEIDDLDIREDMTMEVALAEYFSDPDGDDLGYSASSSDTDVATVAVSGDTAAVTGVAAGSAEVTVTASDGSLSATQTFVSIVRRPTNREVLEILYDEAGGDNWFHNANWLTDRPLDEWHGVGTDADGRVDSLNLRANRLAGQLPLELGDLSDLEWLYLHDNDLTGPIPPELGDLSGLLGLHMHNNDDLEGELPSSFSNLTSLEEFLAHGTGVCVPEALLDWYRDISKRRAMVCADRPADAYMVQAVQSRSHPVPVVADKEALLRVFLTATRTTTETLPPATATFYVDDSETYSVEIDGTSEPIPTEIDEGSLDRSLNVTIPDSVIEEGLSVVIEIDPDSTIDAEILAAKRIPESGELDLGVEGVPDFELTAIPFLYTKEPDSSVIETVEEMADDEEGHELLHDTYDLLPIEEMTVDYHDPVEINTRSGLHVLIQTKAIRAAESGSGYWMGLMTSFSDVRGVADRPGTSSASVPDVWVMAHELGHNLSLWHAPCGGAGRPDPAYPYDDGSIGAWGYDHRGDSLIDKDEVKDLMTYCEPRWGRAGVPHGRAGVPHGPDRGTHGRGGVPAGPDPRPSGDRTPRLIRKLPTLFPPAPGEEGAAP